MCVLCAARGVVCHVSCVVCHVSCVVCRVLDTMVKVKGEGERKCMPCVVCRVYRIVCIVCRVSCVGTMVVKVAVRCVATQSVRNAESVLQKVMRAVRDKGPKTEDRNSI